MSYQLVEKTYDQKDIFIVTIKADSNDADYITTTETFAQEEFDEYAAAALKDLQDHYSGSHQLSDYPNNDDLTIPFDGFDGYCHTLEKLTVEYIDKDGKLWDVKL